MTEAEAFVKIMRFDMRDHHLQSKLKGVLEELLATERGRWSQFLDGAECICGETPGVHCRPCPHYFRDCLRMNMTPGQKVQK
jgi:hypothetical protein